MYMYIYFFCIVRNSLSVQIRSIIIDKGKRFEKKMYIKFANTDGIVYDPEYTNLQSGSIGDMLLLDDGIIIYDRLPNQQSTQLIINVLIDTLRYILQKVYSLQTDVVDIYLPRMSMDMNKEAKIQNKLLQMTTILDYNPYSCISKINNTQQIRNFNVNLIHV